MRVSAILLTALSLVLTGIAIMPTAEAMQAPPPCQTVAPGCCYYSAGADGGFAPCCSPITCPPPVYRCPEKHIATSDFLAYAGPHASVATHNDCSIDVCQGATNTCCTIDGVHSACGTVTCGTPIASASSVAIIELPIPRVGATVNPDCTLTVTETWNCPNGFQETTTHYDGKAVEVYADGCAPMCACMPMNTAAAAAPPGIQPPPQCVMAPCCIVPCIPDPFPVCVTEPCGPQVPPVPGACDLRSATPAPAQGAVWGNDCVIDIESNWSCAPPSGKTYEKDILFVHLSILLCGGNPPPVWQ